MCTRPEDAVAAVAQPPDVHALAAAGPSLDTLTAALAIDPTQLSECDRYVLLEVTAALQAWLAGALEIPALAAVAGANPIDNDDFVREDVRATLHLSRQGAQDGIDIARLLTTTLTRTHTALTNGHLTWAHAKTLVEAVRYTSPDTAQATEAAVLDQAGTMTITAFRRAVATAVLAADPATFEEQHAAAAATRTVTTYPGPAGMATITAELPAHDARTVWLAVDTLAKTHPDPTLGIDARRADALVQLCTQALNDPTLPRQHRRPTTLQVVIDLPTQLALAEHPTQLLGYGPIPPSVARALAADANWQRLVIEPVTGHLLDAGTTTYRPNQELADYILTRTRECAFPPCHAPAHACDIDHGIPHNPHHPDGGATNPANCRPLCRRHHQLKTHGGWTVTNHPDGTTTWTSPTTRIYHSPAQDHRPHSP